MNPVVRVALLGFTAFERNHLEAGLQPGDEPGHRYRVSQSLAACSLAVVNADDEAAVKQVVEQGRLKSTVMLGTTQREGAAAQLSRPFSLLQLLRALEQVVNTAPPMSSAVQRVKDEWARLLAANAPTVVAPPAGSATAALPLIQGPAPSEETPSVRAVLAAAELQAALVVDSNEEVWRFMSIHLPPLGFGPHRVRDCAQALELIKKRPFVLVLLATGLGGMDSFYTCKTIKRSPPPAQSRKPLVVMLLGENAAVEAVRAKMAGADHCLHQPLNAAALQQALCQDLVETQAQPQTSSSSSRLN